MPFIDLSLPERERFLRSQTECHIPGYTGHCPTLRFRHGKGFGTDTREIIQKFKDRPLTHAMKPYKEGDPELAIVKKTEREKDEEPDPFLTIDINKRPYILGYTGFIPGLNFRYGSSYVTAADESVSEFSRRLFHEKRKRDSDRVDFRNVTTKMSSVRNRDEVYRVLHSYADRVSRKPATKISQELPPIAGYTGHIPRLIGSETSLSRRYHSAAKAGLAKLKEEKDRQNHLELAKEAVKNVITCSHTAH